MVRKVGVDLLQENHHHIFLIFLNKLVTLVGIANIIAFGVVDIYLWENGLAILQVFCQVGF